MRQKHQRDKNNGKNGYVGGNPRAGKSRGNFRGQRARLKQEDRKQQ